MGKRAAPAVTAAISVWLLMGAAPVSQSAPGDRLLEEFRAVCLDWDGALDLAEAAAIERGYVHSPELVPEDLIQRQGLWVYAKSVDGVRWLTVLKRNHITTSDGTARFIRCSVSAEPGDLSSTRRAVSRFTGLRSFRQGDTAVFAWTPGEGDTRRAVPRTSFDASLVPLLNEGGLRAVLVAQFQDQVILTLMTPESP